MLLFLDYLYTAFHLLIIGANVFGWIVPSWRKAHLVILLLTLGSWLLIGTWVGHIGYCPLTDGHWDVKRELGETNLPSSFIKYQIDHLFNIDADRTVVDIITILGLLFGFAMAIFYRLKRVLPLKRKGLNSSSG
jgi:hypothetical protein